MTASLGGKTAAQLIKEKFDVAVGELKEQFSDYSGLRGQYGLSHITAEWIQTGEVREYDIGDFYFGTVLSPDTISVTLNDTTGFMSYNFGQLVATNITYEIIDGKFIMHCEDAVDLYNNGNAQKELELSIVEMDGKTCFVLEASNGYYNFKYFIAEQNGYGA
jgi:hypothetical protein